MPASSRPIAFCGTLMDSRRAGFVPEFTPGVRGLATAAVFPAALVAGWAVLAFWPPLAAHRELVLVWQLGLVLVAGWSLGARWGVGVAVLAELLRGVVVPLPWEGAAVFWTLALLLTAWMHRVRRQFVAARRGARLDPLTELPNRLALDEFLTAELGRARRFGRPFSLALLDCDGFKELNDRAGHAAGDAVLCQIARLLRRELRSYDGVFRLAGDEFVLVLPETDRFGAEHVCERLRTAFAHEIERTIPRLGASLGVVTFESPPDDAQQCLALADAAMYRAKRRGPGETEFAVCHGAHRIAGGQPGLLRTDRH